MTPDWKALRAEFPALANWTYLNTATYGQMPRSGADAMNRHLARRDELACGDYLTWFDDMPVVDTAPNLGINMDDAFWLTFEQAGVGM